MYRVSFVDGFCPRPYEVNSLTTEPMGGTESAVTLLAEALSRYAEVEVLQHCRKHPRTSDRGVLYRGVKNWRAEASRQRQGVTIIINSPKLLELWRRGDKRSTLVLWRHNYLGNRHKRMLRLLSGLDACMVCVSRHHLSHSLAHLQGSDCEQRLYAIANPVQVYVPTSATRNPDKLLFCSSPHKGLDQCLALFDSVKRAIPSLQLSICNPGYLPDTKVHERAVEVLGALTRPELHRHMVESLCVFYPQTRFSETFGLVAAESNLLGTPVLAPAGLGALSEVVSDQTQLIDDTDAESLVRVLSRWRLDGPPMLEGLKIFDPDIIAGHWYSLISRLMTNPAQQFAESSRSLTTNS